MNKEDISVYVWNANRNAVAVLEWNSTYFSKYTSYTNVATGTPYLLNHSTQVYPSIDYDRVKGLCQKKNTPVEKNLSSQTRTYCWFHHFFRGFNFSICDRGSIESVLTGLSNLPDNVFGLIKSAESFKLVVVFLLASALLPGFQLYLWPLKVLIVLWLDHQTFTIMSVNLLN